MKVQKITKTKMAKMMKTSRAVVNRLLVTTGPTFSKKNLA